MKRNTVKFTVLLLTLLLAAAAFAGCQSKTNTSFRVLDEVLEPELYGIGLRNEDIALGLRVQEILDEMIADGTAKTISEKWFGEDRLLKNQEYVEESQAAEGDGSLQAILDKGTFIVGLDDSYPPMGFRDENNEIVGFDIDLAAEVCKSLGVELVLQPIDWDAKEMELSSGRIDCIWNGMTINDERVAAMYFAKPYIANEQIVIVPENSKIQKVSDLAGKTIVLQKGSSSLDAIQKQEVFSSIKTVTELSDNVTAFMDLKAGRADAMVVDSIPGYYIMATETEKAK